MPQADIGLVSSTVFFLFLSFLLGYFVWVNFVFPQVVVLFRIKQIVKDIKEKDFNSSLTEATSSRTSISPKNYFSLIPSLVLDLPSDEIPLLVNFVLISLSFYFILSSLLEKSHKDSENFVKSLCDFDFASSIEDANQNRLSAIKYARSASLISLYEVSLKWLAERSHMILPAIASLVYVTAKDLLNDILIKKSMIKSSKLTKMFSKVKLRSTKAATLLLSPSLVKSFRIKK
eukprot:TRINITY_DN1761_c0_g3_i1.p8 TRINITY_DN1761_c0_g3~~TRINITY_DN1761_c0_g3_i1.p8  ORF type:complete len:232 (+),score=4.23 TRINITY_DN1761_c0_g3_i1:9179-9874(+)